MALDFLPDDNYIFDLGIRTDGTNHLQALQGGIVGSLVQAGAEEAASIACGIPCVAVDLSVQYLALGRNGPFRTRARVLRHSEHGAAVRVALVDVGADQKILAVAGVHCEPPRGR